MFALTLFEMISIAHAASIINGDTSSADTDSSHTQTLAVTQPSLPGVDLPTDELWDTEKVQPDESSMPESPHPYAHTSLWLLMIAAGLFGIVAEISHRRTFKR